MNSSLSLRPNRRFISPRARRALAAHGLDIAMLQGSGPNGRILEADVVLHAAQQPVASPSSQTPRASVEASTLLTLRAEADAVALLALHQRFADHALRAAGVSWTPADFVVCAVAKALRAHPDAKRTARDSAASEASTRIVGFWNNDETEQAILIRDEGGLNLLDAARQRLAAEAVSNLEQAPAVTVFDAMQSRADSIEPPQVPHGGASLGLGRIAARPFVANGELGVRPTLHLTLRVDARLWSATLATQFLSFVVEYVEEPQLLVFA